MEERVPDRAGSQGRVPRVLRQVGLWVSVALIAAVSALSYYNIRDLIEQREAGERTRGVLREIIILAGTLREAELGQRGFLITGIEEYLRPYQAAVASLPARIARLRASLADDVEQRTRLDEIDRLQRSALELLALDIAARRERGVAGIDSERLAQGRIVMGRLRDLAAAMGQAETRRLQESDRAAERRADYTLAALGLGTFASVAIIVVVFYFAQVEAGRRRRAEDALRGLNAELEGRVAARTGELERENAERRATEETLRAVIEESPFAIVGLDPKRNVVLWNRAAEKIFGFRADEIVGQPYPLVPEEGRAEFEQIMARTAAGERLRECAVRRRRKDGRLVDIVFSGAPLYDPRGTLRGMLFVLEDVSEKRSIERQLRQAQRMEAVGQLTGGIAHDFNNILSVVVGNLDLLAERLAERGKERGLAEAALRGAMRGAELVQRLLAFARKQPLAPRAMDLNELLPHLAPLLRRVLGEPITVQTVSAAGLWPAVADPAQIEDAILNLAINARDAMPGGGTLTIETANVSFDEAYAGANPDAAVGDYVMLAVSDTGTGMPPEVLERAFEPFFTTKGAGKGSGLGLSMVYGFARQLGGHVKIYSELGHGTSVKLYLPRAGEAAPALSPEAAAAESIPSGSERVLLVEDNPGVREAAEKMLAELGYRVHAVASGPAALAWLDRGEPLDLLFTDIVMPDSMNGHELAEEALRRRPGLRVLFTTGYAEAAMLNGRGLRRDALVLGKPYRKRELARMLRRAIEGDGGPSAPTGGT